MRAFGYLFVTMLVALFAGHAAAAAPARGGDRAPHLAMRLVAETLAPAAGQEVTLALDTRPQPGWHGYWQNPGDAGFPATLRWTLPAGVTAGEPAYPVPGTLLVAGLMNYVFERPYAPLVMLRIPPGLPVGTKLPVRLHAQYLVCTTALCVPEEADLSVDLTVGNGAVTPAARALFDGWRQALPRPLDATATFQASDGSLRIAIPYPADAPLDDAYFFAVTPGLVDYAAPQRVARDGDRVVLQTRPGTGGSGPLVGVLRIAPGRGLLVGATAGTVAAPAGLAASGPSGVWLATLVAFAGAMLGGLILNVMPCVFPILSLKALSLARGHLDPAAARREALAYTAGVVAICLVLGGAILALRAGGSAVGWAFQLQDPRAILVLLLLTVALSFNLSGLFEIPVPGFVNRAGGGAGGAFATGALAAFIATPCTGPFMGAALGAALVLPWPAALAVFAGLGLGLALPFLALGFVPALRRRLPRPGRWMETFRRILAVPMWLTAIALAWVLGRQTGVDGMTLGLVVAFAAGLVLWTAGRRQRGGFGFGAPRVVILAVILVAGVWAIGAAHRPAASIAPVAGAEPFTEARLAALKASGRPVFAYFTADWCLTCKVNEKVAIDTDSTRAAFAAHNVAVLVGDWTDGDPALGRFIQAHNRAGVPLYLYYAPGEAEPRVLPQVLTPGMLAAL